MMRVTFLTGLLLAALTTPVFAADDSTGIGDSPWEFGANIYMWLPSAPLTLKVDQMDVSNLPESFDTILDSLQFMAMFELEAHKGRLWFFASPVFYEGQDKEGFTGLLGESRRLTVNEDAWVIDFGVAYDLFGEQFLSNKKSSAWTISPFVGGFYFRDNIRMTVDPGMIDNGLKIRETVEFVTPIAGVASRMQVSDRWGLRFSAQGGVFDDSKVNSIREYIAMVQYDFKSRSVPANFFFGYRYLHLDLEDNPIELHVDVKGPMLGVGFEF